MGGRRGEGPRASGRRDGGSKVSTEGEDTSGIQMDSVEEEEEERSGGRKIRAAALCCGGPSDRHTRTVPTMGTGLYRGRR